MTTILYIGLAAVPVLIVGYIAALRWATRAEQPTRR